MGTIQVLYLVVGDNFGATTIRRRKMGPPTNEIRQINLTNNQIHGA